MKPWITGRPPRVAALALFCLIPFTAVPAVGSETSFEEYAAFFDYDRELPLEVVIRGVEERSFYDRIDLAFRSVNDQWVTAWLYVPKDLDQWYESKAVEDPDYHARLVDRNFAMEPPWPSIVYMHFLMDDKTRASMMGPRWAEYGLALLSLDGVNRGERRPVNLTDCEGGIISEHTEYTWAVGDLDARVAESHGALCRERGPGNILVTDIARTQQNLRQQIIDIMRGVDLTASRPELDPERIGFIGISMGALTGAISCALDHRIKVVALADGAASITTMFEAAAENPDPMIKDEMEKIFKEIEKQGYTLQQALELLDPVDPIHFVDRISPRPVIMVNGRFDEILPFPAIEKLHQTVQEPKRVVIYNSGHLLPINAALHEIFMWYREHL